MNLHAALINRGTTRMPSKEGVNSTLVSNPVPVSSTIYGLRQNRTYRDHELTSCAFRCPATAAVSESRRAKGECFFFIVGVIVLIIAKIISKDRKNILKMNKKVRMLLPKKDLIQEE